MPPAVADQPTESAVAEVESLDAPTFFAEALALTLDNPPEPPDRPPLADLRAVAAGSDRAALEAGARAGREAIRTAAAQAAARVDGWRLHYDPGRSGSDYLRRAAAARVGLEPATDELPGVLEADADGRPLSGHERYLLRFPPNAAPPVNGF